MPIFFVETIFKRSQEDVVKISWRFTVEMLTDRMPFLVCIAIGKGGFFFFLN